jgi:sec-independent protein translocase protein TatA
MIVPAVLFSPGPWELGILLVIIMMFFGVGKLPQVGKALGNSLRAFKEGQKAPPIDVTPSTDELPQPANAQAEGVAQAEEVDTL